jgi:glyoxylase I family protein
VYTLHHIAISVSDLEKSVAFYGMFDFRRVGDWQPEDGSYQIINLRNDAMMLELFCYARPEALPEHAKVLRQDLPVLGVKHFGLQVKAIDQAKKSLQEKGFEILDEDINEDHSGANYFFVKDPDGILVEVIEDNRGY